MHTHPPRTQPRVCVRVSMGMGVGMHTDAGASEEEEEVHSGDVLLPHRGWHSKSVPRQDEEKTKSVGHVTAKEQRACRYTRREGRRGRGAGDESPSLFSPRLALKVLITPFPAH
eukprot:NODE_10_length_5895_cov_8478.258638_g8_i0.p6 GENE.NODE_10_length_5895_cov_8478.258638_g8_i0~~NODE_10_length_5895_cov_8478.258638_g8_i0.p6  ORF type:complete len:114 (-),score=2.16 NODE_10_length_5895_cov_8478.258638_g8_i0:4498-4839(-)